MAKYLTTAKKAIGKIIKTEIGSMVCNSTNETLKKSFTDAIAARGATDIQIEEGEPPLHTSERDYRISYKIDGIHCVQTLGFKLTHNDYSLEAICNDWCRGFDIKQPQNARYIKQITGSILGCTLQSIIGFSDQILDAIEDCIINKGLYYVHCAIPLHGTTATFVPFVNAFHPHHSIKSVKEIVTPFGLAYMVDVAKADQCLPEDDLLFEIGKVDYDVNRKAKRSSLYANTKGKIFSSALSHHHGYPIIAAHFQEYNPTTTSTYIDDNFQERPINSGGIRFDRLSDRQSTDKLNPNDKLILFDVTSQALPLIKPRSRIHNFLQATQCK
jgi:hypothetical protein